MSALKLKYTKIFILHDLLSQFYIEAEYALLSVRNAHSLYVLRERYCCRCLIIVMSCVACYVKDSFVGV
jgi:hypothetical protein